MSAAQQIELTEAGTPATPRLDEDKVTDVRFRALVGEEGWARLPEAVRHRFSKRWKPGDMVVYQGHVVATELSRLGCVLAFLARAIGAPLPVTNGMTGPAVVAVSENAALGGQTWTRAYACPGKFPQVIHSAKRFSGPTGLEEYVGYGFGMTLRVLEEEDALVFRSERYFFEVGRLRLQIPRFAEPGAMEIVHRDEGGGQFSFHLTLRHRIAGRLMHQLAYFRDP
jgi:uncharacterized protein DUF4166